MEQGGFGAATELHGGKDSGMRSSVVRIEASSVRLRVNRADCCDGSCVVARGGVDI